ncbi:MAG: hypothetical protein LBM38_00990 [Clostridiales bacterium]|jgi:hypothetical protein|nr:hypothetical protein [Clostridiales bacterium]
MNIAEALKSREEINPNADKSVDELFVFVSASLSEDMYAAMANICFDYFKGDENQFALFELSKELNATKDDFDKFCAIVKEKYATIEPHLTEAEKAKVTKYSKLLSTANELYNEKLVSQIFDGIRDGSSNLNKNPNIGKGPGR